MKLYSALVALCALSLGGCAFSNLKGVSDLGVPYEISKQGPVLVQGLQIGFPWTSKQGELLLAQVEVKNTTQFPLSVHAFFRWENKYGFVLLSPGNVPQLHQLPPGSALTLSSVAPSERAHGFNLKITEAN